MHDVLQDQGRGVVGALLLGTPLLFTMETWWLAWTLPAWILVAFTVGGLAVIVNLVRWAGFRRRQDRARNPREWVRQWTELVFQSVVAVYIMVFLFGIAHWNDPVAELVRLGLLATVPFALGAAVANSILKGADTDEAERSPLTKKSALFALGGLFFSLPIAPTEEMPLMAAHAGWWRLAGVVVATVLVTYLALYEMGLRGQAGRMHRRVVHRVGEAAMVYVIGLAVAFSLLAGYGHFAGEPVTVWLQQTIVLGFMTAMGGAAAQVVV